MAERALPGAGCVLTVGTFDGVHRGHAAVLRQLAATGQRLQLPTVLVSFDPHPLRIVHPDAAPRLLSTSTEKIEILAQSPLDYLALFRFTPGLAAYSPRRFVEEMLLGRLGMRHFVIGYDHGFGRGRSGDVATLQAIGDDLGFEVTVVEPVHVPDGPISSTRIRRAHELGDVAAAAASDRDARESLERYADRLARALATVINIFDPEVVVLGGGKSNVAWLYDEVPRRWGAWIFSDRVDTKLRPPVHGDASGVRGAAWLWPAEH